MPNIHRLKPQGLLISFGPVNLSFGARFKLWFNHHFEALLTRYDHWVKKTLERPAFSLTVLLGLCAALMLASLLLGVAYFPRTDPGQFVVNVKAPTGTRLEDTAPDIKQVEAVIRRIVDPADLVRKRWVFFSRAILRQRASPVSGPDLA